MRVTTTVTTTTTTTMARRRATHSVGRDTHTNAHFHGVLAICLSFYPRLYVCGVHARIKDAQMHCLDEVTAVLLHLLNISANCNTTPTSARHHSSQPPTSAILVPPPRCRCHGAEGGCEVSAVACITCGRAY